MSVNYADPASYSAHAFLKNDEEPGIFPLEGMSQREAEDICATMATENQIAMVNLIRTTAHGESVICTYGG